MFKSPLCVLPSFFFIWPRIAEMRELFPDPTGPTMTFKDPFTISKLMFLNSKSPSSQENDPSIISIAFVLFLIFTSSNVSSSCSSADRKLLSIQKLSLSFSILHSTSFYIKLHFLKYSTWTLFLVFYKFHIWKSSKPFQLS